MAETEETEATTLLKKFFERIEEGDEPKTIITDLLQELQTKTEYEEIEYPPEAYLYVPTVKKPKTWRFRVKIREGKKLVLDKYMVFQALRNFSESWSYNSLPGDDMEQVKKSFQAVMKKLKIDEKYYPPVLKEAEYEPTEDEEFLTLAKALGLFEDNNKTTNDDTINNTNGGDNDVEISEITFEQLQAGNPSLIKSIKEIVVKELDTKNSVVEKETRIEELEAELKTEKEATAKLAKEVDDYKVAEAINVKKARVAEILADSKLPDTAITETFTNQLHNAKDEDEINALIADRRALVEKESGKVNESNSDDEDDTTDKEPVTKEDILKSIKS